MSQSNFDADPDAASYYSRLGVPEDADQQTIIRAGKLAFKEYSEEKDAFIEVSDARAVLEDEDQRRNYDRFCRNLGDDVGTEIFEEWQNEGEVTSVQEKIEEVTPDLTPDATSYYRRLGLDENTSDAEIHRAGRIALHTYSEGSRRKRLETAYWTLRDATLRNCYDELCAKIGVEDGTERFESSIDPAESYDRGEIEEIVDEVLDELSTEGGLDGSVISSISVDEPEVIWSNGITAERVTVNFWNKHDHKRLYINEFHGEGDVYLDLNDGRFYSETGRELRDIFATVQADDKIYIKYQNRELQIDPVGEPEPTTETIREPETEPEPVPADPPEPETGFDNPPESKTWLQQVVSRTSARAGEISPALSTLVTFGYGLLWLAVVPITGLCTALLVFMVTFGALGAAGKTLLALFFGGAWIEAIIGWVGIIVCFVLATIGILILEQFGIDIE